MDKWLRSTNFVRIAALAIGIMLWAVVHLEMEQTARTTTTLNETEITGARVTIKGLDEDQYHIRSMEPLDVDVTMRGKGLSKYINFRYQIVLDLKGYREGKHVIPLKAIGFPDGATVQLNPATVYVDLEKLERKEVPVSIKVKGKPDPEMRAGVPIANPTKVIVTIPSSQSDEIVTVEGIVDITGAKENVSKEVRLVAYNAGGKEVDVAIDPQVVQVEVPVTPPLKAVPLQVRYTGEPAPGFSIHSIQQNVKEIVVYGPENILKDLELLDGVSVDVSGMNKDTTTEVEVPLKDDVLSVEPRKVKVQIDIEPTVVKTFEAVPIQVTGVKQGLEVRFDPETSKSLTLKVSGSAANLEKLKAEDLHITVDVTGLTPNTYTLPLNIVLPTYIRRESPEQPLVSIVIYDPTAAASDTEEDLEPLPVEESP